MSPRLKVIGADLDRVLFITGETGFSFDDDLGRLRDLFAAHPDIRLLIVDPLSAYLGGKADSYKDADVRRVLSPLSAMADETDVAIIGIMHHKKGKGSSAIEKITGSGAFPAVARSALTFGRDPEDPERVLVAMTKSNNAKRAPTMAYRIEEDTSVCDSAGTTMELPKLVWDGESNLTADEIVNAQPDSGSKGHAVAWLQHFLADGEKPSSEVEEAAAKVGIAWRTLERAKKEIGFKAFRKSDTWYWPQLAANTDQLETAEQMELGGVW